MLSHPEQLARSRYSQSFQSKIFEPEPARNPARNPGGKRRDQTTAELFGHYDEKDLRSMPKTFKPKEEEFTAREKKQNFLGSQAWTDGGPQQRGDVRQAGPDSEVGFVQATRRGFDPYQEEEAVDGNLRRQEELKSKLFGRATPAVSGDAADARNSRLTPNDFKWNTMPEYRGPPMPDAGPEVSQAERAYQEKCSGLFDHRSPHTLADWESSQRRLQEEDIQGEAKRRNNVYYSDLFGRSSDMHRPDAPIGERRPRTQGGAEEKIIVHQDWTNAATELMHTREPPAEHAYQRKSDELHKSTRIFGASREEWHPADKMDPVTHDNSEKLRSARGRGTQQMHQAHLRTSTQSDEFYDVADNSKHWEVAELHLSGLRSDANDDFVRDLCQGVDLQLVKVVAEMDPVRNLCKGRAKVMVRYNPKRGSIGGLVDKFEAAHLKVDM